MSELEQKEMGREEVRGLFTLGLMAILISMRIAGREITFYLFGFAFDMSAVVDAALFFWGVYAFLIIVWLSDDWLPKKICRIAYAFGTAMLFCSFLIFYITGVAVFSILPLPFHLFTYVLLVPAFYISL